MIEQLGRAPRVVASLPGKLWVLARAVVLELRRAPCEQSASGPPHGTTVPAPASAAEAAVRTYLRALRDPDSLRDQDLINQLTDALSRAEDPIERLHLRQRLIDAASPSLQHYEDDFVIHAKAWADQLGLGMNAFTDHVSRDVLHRAGFRR